METQRTILCGFIVGCNGRKTTALRHTFWPDFRSRGCCFKPCISWWRPGVLETIDSPVCCRRIESTRLESNLLARKRPFWSAREVTTANVTSTLTTSAWKIQQKSICVSAKHVSGQLPRSRLQTIPSAVHMYLRIPCVCWSSISCPSSCPPQARFNQRLSGRLAM